MVTRTHEDSEEDGDRLENPDDTRDGVSEKEGDGSTLGLPEGAAVAVRDGSCDGTQMGSLMVIQVDKRKAHKHTDVVATEVLQVVELYDVSVVEAKKEDAGVV